MTMYITALANTLAANLPDEKRELLASIFSQLGDTLATISAQQALLSACKSKAESKDSTSKTTGTASEKA